MIPKDIADMVNVVLGNAWLMVAVVLCSQGNWWWGIGCVLMGVYRCVQ